MEAFVWEGGGQKEEATERKDICARARWARAQILL